MLPLDEIFSQPLPALEGEFGFTPWPAPALASAPAPDSTASLEEPDQAALSLAEERRHRRRISNRESARRSRKRKQRHLEELLNQAGQLHSENQVLADRLVGVVHRCLLFHRDNDRLRAEFTALSRHLSELRRLLVVRHLRLLSSPSLPPPPPPPPAVSAAAPCGGFASAYEQTLASLIA